MKHLRAAIPARDVYAVAGALLFLALGFGTILLVAKVADVKDGAVLATVLLLPTLLYLLLSGRVSEFRAPGGLAVKLSQVAMGTIPVHGGAGGAAALSYEEVHAVQKGRTESFLKRIRSLTPDDPVVLTLTMGTKAIDGGAAADYARGLTQFPRFRFVAIVDRDGKLVSYMDERAFRHVIESDLIDAQYLLNNIEHENVDAVQAYPGMIRATVSAQTSVADALRAMQAARKSALLVTEDGRVTGIVEGDALANALLLSLVDHVGDAPGTAPSAN